LEAQQAVALAPNSVRTNVVFPDVPSAMGRQNEAGDAYQKALTLVPTVEPEFQVGLVGQKLAVI
jgi:hypothetical protein